jgi:hypothetical protein
MEMNDKDSSLSNWGFEKMQYALTLIDSVYASIIMMLAISAVWVFAKFGVPEGVATVVIAASIEHFLLRKIVFLRIRRTTVRRFAGYAVAEAGSDKFGLLSIVLHNKSSSRIILSRFIRFMQYYTIATYALASFMGIQGAIDAGSASQGIRVFSFVWAVGMTGAFIIAALRTIVFYFKSP